MKTEIPQQEKNNQDIDIFQLFKLIGNAVDNLGFKVFKFFKFIIKNIFVLIGLIIIGTAIGYFIDQNKKPSFRHEIIVTPNFGSNTLLYKEVEEFKSDSSIISSVQIEPIIDMYNFSKERWSNMDFMKLLFQQDIKIDKFTEESNVEKIYRYHLLTINSKEEDVDGSVINTFLDKINKDPYYISRRNIENSTIQSQIAEAENSINNINQILNTLGTTENQGGSGVNISNVSDIHQLINTKKSLLEDITILKVSQIENSKVVYDTSSIVNIETKGRSRMVILPVVFVFFFFVGAVMFRFYKKYKGRELE